jgi:hypothetical protein
VFKKPAKIIGLCLLKHVKSLRENKKEINSEICGKELERRGGLFC